MGLDEQLVRYARDLARVYADREELDDAWARVMVRLLELRVPELRGHHRRVAYWSQHLNRALGNPLAPRALLRAAELHDAGLLALDDEPIRAWFAATARGERPPETMRKRLYQHAPIMAELVRHLPGMSEAAEWIRYHHERWDGRGLFGLAAEEIPLGARVLAVAEVFDHLAFLSKRLSLAAAREKMEAEAGQRLDPELTAAFLSLPLESLIANLEWIYEDSGD